MSQPIQISTSKYTKQGKVDIDGHVWEVKLPGAGTELRLSQAFRSSKLYTARIQSFDARLDAYDKALVDFEKKVITQEQLDKFAISDTDLDRYEEYNDKQREAEKTIFSFFTSIFKDDTEDNSEVKAWVEETPTAIIQLAFEDVKNQANGKDEDGSEETPASI